MLFSTYNFETFCSLDPCRVRRVSHTTRLELGLPDGKMMCLRQRCRFANDVSLCENGKVGKPTSFGEANIIYAEHNIICGLPQHHF